MHFKYKLTKILKDKSKVKDIIGWSTKISLFLIFFIFIYLVILFIHVFYREALARRIDDVDNIKTDMLLNVISLLLLSPIIFIGWYSLIAIPIVFILNLIIFTGTEACEIKLDK